ncbi:pilus assembly protein [Pseudomonadota bacterium]
MRHVLAGLECALCLALLAPPLAADDIDIYSPAEGAQPSACSGLTTSLVAGSLPLGNAGRSRIQQDIYFNLFQPGTGTSWRGNIKKLKLAAAGAAAVGAADSASGGIKGGAVIAQAPLTDPPVPAISPEDGQILPHALTFWTDPAGADVLAFNPDLGEVSGRDGRSVSRGGAGQQVPGFLAGSPGANNGEAGARQLFTLDPATDTGLLPLDASLASLAALGPTLDPAGSMTDEQKLSLLRWVRGLDSFDADGDGDHLEARSWLLADALHSRPLAVSYGVRPGTGYSEENPEIRLFFGSNDGFFHSLLNTDGSIEARESGRETWAFIPPALLGMQAQRARGEQPEPGAHRYGLDGEAAAYILDRDRDGNIEAAQGDKVWVYIGQRRGGNRLFAFDMSDPDRPRFKWDISDTTAGFQQLAMTFSTPRIAHLDLGEAAPTPVLIFGGGYNGGWDGAERIGKDAGAGADTRGNAIYVVHADTGVLIWKAVGPGAGEVATAADDLLFVPGLTDSIPSPLAVIDADHNGVEDRAYVGDSGGKVWRIDLSEHGQLAQVPGAAAPGSWRLQRLATLGGSGESDRRFFHAPDVVQSRDQMGDYDGVVILSGNRASPGGTGVRDYAYLLKDRGTVDANTLGDSPPAAEITHSQLAEISEACSIETASGCDTGELSTGWKLALQAPGEKGLSTPLVSHGTVLFTTYVPAANSAGQPCPVPYGSARTYALALEDGSARAALAGSLVPQGEPASYLEIGPGLRGDVIPLRDGVLVPGTGIAGEQLLTIPGRSKWRAYWRQEGIDEP